jgi:hypothetical protein
MQVLDTIATVLLFIVLIGWVWLSIYLGASSVMLSDSGAPGIAIIGVVLAVVGIPLSVIAVYVIAVIRAWHADGSTFYYPLVAFVVGTVLAALVMGVAMGIVRLGLRLHGTDEERRRDDKGKQPRDAGGSAEAEAPRVEESVETAATPAPSRVLTFDTTHEFRDGSLFVELGIEREAGRRYLKTPMPQRNGEWEEYYGIDLQEYATFVADATKAHRFATECRRQEHPDRWLFWPGARAPEPITIDRTRLAKKRAILLTDQPTNSSGVPVQGLPVGTPFVRVVGSGVDLDGNVQARLPAVDSPIVSIAADQLGL